MGLFGAMTASVSGLASQGEAISVISDNLANTNTVGYKSSRALFSQLVTSSGVSGTEYNAGGINTAVRRDQATQGSLNSSNSVTDLAISGNGFFRVASTEEIGTSTEYFYTRAGAFSEDKKGFLVTPTGYYLQGWRTDSAGNIANLQNLVNVELQSVGVSAQATNELELGVNLNSTQATLSALYDTTGTLASSLNGILASSNEGIYLTDARIFDSQGTARDVTFAFSKRAANLWDWQLYTDGSNIQSGTSGTETLISNGTLEFNPNGTLKNATNTTASVVWSGGVDVSTLTLNFGDYSGGKVVSATSGGLGFQGTTVAAVTANTVPATTDVNAFGTSLAAGTYTLRRDNATSVSLYDATNTVLVEGPVAVTTTGAQTIAFATSGVTYTVDGTWDISGVLDGAAIGTTTIGTTDAGDVMGISVEDNSFAAGTYTVRKTSATTMGLYTAGGTLIESAAIGAAGLREVFFSTSKVRLTYSDNFDETNGVYPATVGTFTVADQAALSQGLANDGVIQFASDFNTSFVNQDGFGSGNLSAIQIDEDGYVAGTFTNGETKRLYKLALAVFQNPRGLEAISGSLLRVTDVSGQALIKEPGVSGTGRIVSGALEGSTTDIASEFSQMIVAQRAFQANSTVITTVDQMLNELLQLR
ncbi:MAG: flagellar hook-basal body complex protein [Pseudomonadaceae bacterium]|nr:flagellar hook-basal body complex protein [Pseudomonadaceae bacterium]